MKRLLLLSLTVSIYACQQPQEKSQEQETSTELVEEPVLTDSVIFESDSASDTAEEIKPVFKGVSIPNDTKGNRVLIDRVHVFETGEPYVWVGLKEGYDWRAMDSLKKYADSVIFEGEFETKRTRYPWDRAQQYLDLELLDGITIFNYQHENLGISDLKRIEYFEDVLGDQFIAVLEPSKKLVGNQFYGINGINQFIENLESQVVSGSAVKDSVRDYVNIKSKYQWDISSTIVHPYNLIYTFYSFLTQEDQEKSYLIEINSVFEYRLLAEITNDYSISDLIPVPIQLNKRPLLLLWVGPPETDIEWFTPAVFNGVHYEIPNSRILELNQFRRFSRTDNDSIQCSGEVLHATQRNINDLDATLIYNFLRTFDKECINNVEYSEWSNELLFEILDKYSGTLATVLTKPNLNTTLILDEIESPVTDKYLPSVLISKISLLPISPIRDAILSSLRVAESNYE